MSEPPPAHYLGTWSQFRTNTNPGMTWPTGGTVAGLRAAIVQQMTVRPMNTLIGTQGWDARKVAGRLAIPQSTFYGVLAGTRPMHLAHLGAFLAFTDQMPSMDDIRQRILLVTVQRALAAKIRTAGGVPGDLWPRSKAQQRALETLSALTIRVIERTEDDDTRDRVLGEAATAPLRDSARRLAAAHGLVIKPDDTSPAPLVGSHLRANPEPIGVDGFWTPDGPILTADLPPDWAETVAARGWAIIDDHFILSIRDSDPAGRPTDVIALTLTPLGGDGADTTLEQRTWNYRSATSRITWQTGLPRLNPSINQ